MGFSPARYMFLLTLLLLSGCFSSLNLISRISFEDQERASGIVPQVLALVFEHAEDIGGACKLVENGGYCRFPDRGGADATSIGVGMDRNGLAYFRIHTALTVLFPKSEENMRAGKYIPDFHREWEQWAVENLGDIKPQTRIRKYSNIGVFGTF